ncbi:hypothetical protein SEA_LYMARA_57 [Arthrobacter phage Lymara]|uniref:Uncharacterized protein n=1 Tax=Arthrobacter phage Lymara TaxID=2599828 RepID=A0A5J6TX23_9CAUD|nr:hypothetical protein HYQ01_gp057 [Arthrobacter phage Lymara]QFG14858.1 hypothetical protein SEA_LYMARA_57 [Arthrobacter phage Lymara]
MKLTHRDTKFDVQILGELRNFTIETRTGAVISVSEGADGSLHLHEGSHRSLRIVPVVANAVRIDVVDPFLEQAAPMTPIPDIAALVKLDPGSRLYSVATQTVYTWHGGAEPHNGHIVTSDAGSGWGTTPEFWDVAAPLLLAAHPESRPNG